MKKIYRKPALRRLGLLRNANRGDVEGLRTWLRDAAEELVTVTQLVESVQHRPDRTPAG